MKRLAMLLALSLVSGAAMGAETGNSLLFQQPKDGGHLINLGYDLYSGVKGDTKNTAGATTGEMKAAPAELELTYLYGISDTFAMGAGLSFGSTKVTSTPTGGPDSDISYSGMGDLNVWAVGNSPMETMVLRYGGFLGVSPGNAQEADITANKAGNRYSGGMSLTPYIAAEWGNESMTYGVALQYAYKMDRKRDDHGTPVATTTIKGGNILSLKPYLEMPYTNGVASFYLQYDSIGSSTETLNNSDTNLDGYTAMTLGAQTKYDFTPTIAGRAGLAYVSETDRSFTGSKATLTGITMDVGAVFNY